MNENGAITWTNETRKLRDLVPWDHNPREIHEAEADRLGESLRLFGQIQTIAIAPDNSILDGHQRRLVWSVLPTVGPDHEVDVRVSSRALTEQERQQLVVYLHRGTNAAWNWDELGNSFEVSDLLDWGFSEDELQLNWGSDEPTPDPGAQVDKADALQEKWQVQRGQVWQCGEHFVICGDCREPGTWTRLLEAAGIEKVNGVFTSPPYAEQRKEQYGGVPVDEYVDWWEAVQANVRDNLADDGSFFVNIKPHCEDGERVLYVFDLVLAMRRRWEWACIDELCWKTQGVPGEWPNRFKNSFEPVYHFSCSSKCKFRPGDVVGAFKSNPDNLNLYGSRESKWASRSGSSFRGHKVKSKRYRGALPGNVLEIATSSLVGHSGAFPTALPDFFIRAYSDAADVWIDPFLGSGTTIVAAHQNERHGLGIERLEKYVSVSLERLAGMGLQPRLVEQ